MKYKVGDKVRVKKNLLSDTSYGKHTFISEMERFRGENATITQADNDTYQIDIDNAEWYWSGEMLEPVEFTKADLKLEDILTTRSGARIYVKDNGYTAGFGSDGIYLADDLTNTGVMGKHFDVVKVERPQVIWERPEEKTNEELHREMWNWLAENPRETKKHWCKNHGYTGHDHPLHHCFACEECNKDCSKCPLDSRIIGCDGGLYYIWDTTTDLTTKIRLAKVIANLPWKSKEKTE